MLSCWRSRSCCRVLLLLLVVQLDGERDGPPPYSHQEDLNLAADFGLVLSSH